MCEFENKCRLLRLLNVTAHDQSSYKEQLRECGVEVVANCSFDVDASHNDVMVREIADDTIRNFADDVDGILVGGLTSSMFYCILSALDINLRVFEIVTERIRDKNNRFVFNFKGIREIRHPNSWRVM